MPRELILNSAEMSRIQTRLVTEIMKNHDNLARLVFIGVERRGVDLARRLVDEIEEKSGVKIPLGSLDINLYRDDWNMGKDGGPIVRSSQIPFAVNGAEIILVDDVLFSGRTVRAALEAILDYGRPAKVELLVFIDRDERELPICADYAGKKIKVQTGRDVETLFSSRDGEDAVYLR